MALDVCFDRLKPLRQCAQSPNVYLTSYRSSRPIGTPKADRLAYKLYGLTAEEIGIVESGGAG